MFCIVVLSHHMSHGADFDQEYPESLKDWV